MLGSLILGGFEVEVEVERRRNGSGVLQLWCEFGIGEGLRSVIGASGVEMFKWVIVDSCYVLISEDYMYGILY